MDELTALTALNGELDRRTGDDPLAALALITDVRRDIAERERAAVFRALETHSWREIGEALGVTKQAAFQRFGREWVRMAQAALPPADLERTIKGRLDR